MSYVLIYECVRKVNRFDEPEWHVRRRMKPPFFGSYEIFKRKKDALTRTKLLNDQFNKVTVTVTVTVP